MKNDKLIRLKSVLDQNQVCKSHWYVLVAQGLAPKPIKYGRSSFWSQNEINGFIERVKKENRGELQGVRLAHLTSEYKKKPHHFISDTNKISAKES